MSRQVNFDPIALSYNRVADRYEAGRPGYQDHIVQRVRDLVCDGPSGTTLDLAAGTGKFTRTLRGAADPVIAIEPVREMAAELTRATGVPAARAYAGRLPVADARLAAITVAQAFQWFDQADVAELARALQPGGLLALVWNRRQETGEGAVVEDVIAPYRRAPRRTNDAPSMIETSGAFSPPSLETWEWVRQVGREEIHDHVASLSWIAALDDDERAVIRDDLDDAIGYRAGLAVEYRSELVWARRLQHAG